MEDGSLCCAQHLCLCFLCIREGSTIEKGELAKPSDPEIPVNTASLSTSKSAMTSSIEMSGGVQGQGFRKKTGHSGQWCLSYAIRH